MQANAGKITTGFELQEKIVENRIGQVVEVRIARLPLDETGKILIKYLEVELDQEKLPGNLR